MIPHFAISPVTRVRHAIVQEPRIRGRWHTLCGLPARKYWPLEGEVKHDRRCGACLNLFEEACKDQERKLVASFRPGSAIAEWAEYEAPFPACPNCREPSRMLRRFTCRCGKCEAWLCLRCTPAFLPPAVPVCNRCQESTT